MLIVPKTWVNIKTVEDVLYLQEDLEVCARVAVDTETTGLAVTDEVFGVSFGVGDCDGDKKLRRVYWCNFNFVDDTVKAAVLDVLRLLFETGRWNVIFFNAPFDMKMIRASFDIKMLHENINCGMMLAILLCKWGTPGLKFLTGVVLGRQPVWAKEVDAFKVKMGFKGKEDDFPYTLIPEEMVFPYACEDAENTFDLFYALLQLYRYENKSLQEIYKLERRVTRVSAKLEFHGMTIDLPYFQALRARLEEELAVDDLYYSQRWGQYKNTKKVMVPTVQSSDRLGRILFDSGFPDGLKLPVELAEHTPTGKISVKMANITANFPDNPEIQRLAMYVFKQYVLNNYATTMTERYVPWVEDDGSPALPTIHTSFWQIKATGRFSSSNPNLQNISNDKLETEEEREYSVRRGFIAPKGFLYFTADFKAFEVVILANASQDPKLVKHCLDGIDFHSTVGSMAYHRPYEELRRHVDELARRQRTMIKKTSFAFIYGAGVKRIATTTGITLDEAQGIKDALRAAYPDMMYWWDETVSKVGFEGKVFTLCGRLRRIPSNKAYNWAVNTVCQGTAADILKYALAELEVLLQGRKSRQVHHVHDEIHFYLHPDDVELVPQIVEIMQRRRFDPPNGGTYVPFLAELSTGPNWSDMTETTVENVMQQLREMKQ